MMKRGDLLLSLLTLAVGLITAAAPIYVAYDIYDRGPAPEKRLELKHWFVTNPTKNLSSLANKAHLILTVEDKTVGNLVIAHDLLRNTGRVPVLPSDYFQNLTVSVSPPWYIVAVESSKDGLGNVPLRWKRNSDTQFEAEPSLLNPGDSVSTVVYLTNTNVAKTLSIGPDPTTLWDARITNLRMISTASPERFDEGSDKYFPFEVPFTDTHSYSR
jgi:hypothetical protein